MLSIKLEPKIQDTDDNDIDIAALVSDELQQAIEGSRLVIDVEHDDGERERFSISVSEGAAAWRCPHCGDTKFATTLYRNNKIEMQHVMSIIRQAIEHRRACLPRLVSLDDEKAIERMLIENIVAESYDATALALYLVYRALKKRN